jgi:hypothetical protein
MEHDYLDEILPSADDIVPSPAFITNVTAVRRKPLRRHQFRSLGNALCPDWPLARAHSPRFWSRRLLRRVVGLYR